jgi:hypothetical protein
MKNPFLFGVVVKGNDFCDREEEINEIISDLNSGVNITLISPRRYGKTSLLLNLFDRLDFDTFYVDLMGVTTARDFLDIFLKAFVEKLGGVKKITSIWKRFFPNVEDLQINLGPFGFNMKIKPTIRNIEEILSLPEKIGKKVIVAFDEFQEIVNIKEVDLLSLLRKKAQMFENTTFIFAGSRRHVMTDIFTNVEKPFYRFSKIYNLGSLNKDEAISFVLYKFNSTNIKIERKVIEKMYEVCEGHPFYIQYISHTLWNICNTKQNCNEDDLENAIEQVLITERPMFETLWDSLTPNQKQVLKNVANNISPYEIDLSAGSVKAALDKLRKLDVIEKENRRYKMVDPLFSIWLKNL